MLFRSQSPETYQNVRWMPRGWAWVDPQKEVDAYKAAEMAGYITKAEIISENGGDIEDVFTQRRRELDMAEQLQLYFDTTSQQQPAQVNITDTVK